MPDNVENLLLSNARNDTGNAINNVLNGDGGSQTLELIGTAWGRG